jgi:uncharacterized protein
MSKFVLFYESAEEGMPKARLHFADHRARWSEFQERGTLLMIGPYANPKEGALAIFTTREAAEEFVSGDPFVIHGVVGNWYVREWNEAILTP